MADVLDAWAERSAIMEFDGGMSRFEAETRAAESLGVTRHEMLKGAGDEIGGGHSARGRDTDAPLARQPRKDDLSGVQRNAAEENRPMSQPDAQAGRNRLDVLALQQ